MTTPTLNYYPDLGAQRKMKPAVQQTKFGDGYEARVPTGINNMLCQWQVKFTRNWADAGVILAFLEAQAGVTSFNWTDPLNNTNLFVCRTWDIQQTNFGVYCVSGTFEQVMA